jgi:signal transduction histidine kinase
MRIVPAVTVVALLVLLLTWLSLRAIDPNAERFDLALREMDNFKTLEAALHRDVLSARAGVLRNYDPLVRETGALDVSIARLRQVAATDIVTKTAIDRLAVMVVEQGHLVEQFKSDNALLQNSLAYFALSSSDWGGSVAPSVSSLAAAMLRLTLDTSSASAHEVQDRLDELAREPFPSGDAEAVQALLAHGRLLRNLLPATDTILKALFAVPQTFEPEALRAMILSQQSASRATARQFRLLLYVTSLVLVGLLVHLGFRLQARSWALRRRAAFEHVLAGISMRFIAAGSKDFDTVVEQALAEMAKCARVDRAYFLLAGPCPRTYAWCSHEVAFTQGWPDQALPLADRCNPTIDGTVHIPCVKRMQLGAERDSLVAAGLQGWACVSRREMDGSRILLGFDYVRHPCRITQAGGLGLLRMALDVIANALDRQFFEQERARLELRLHQARRLETVGTFASGIAHNFNNIVGAILGYTEMAYEQHVSSGILEEIRRAGERARELVDQILNFARRRDMHRNPVSIRALVAEATSLLRVSLPATIEIAVREVSDELIVSGVHAQLQQVILNLCSNAAQSMAYSGRIELDIDASHVTNMRTLSHGVITPGHYARVLVSDTGHGIGEADRERIFEPFFTTRMTGSGLGLATTREIVREHGGAMHVQSVVGAGSRFEVWLPRIAAVPSTSGEDIATLSFGHGETVLLIEGDPERLLKDEEIFAAIGYEPVGVTRAADALARCQESADRFDVVVVGHLAPVAASLDLAVALHESAPGLPILLAIASANDFGTNALVAAGISDVVAWPITATEIATALYGCLRRGTSWEERGLAPNGGHVVQNIAAHD